MPPCQVSMTPRHASAMLCHSHATHCHIHVTLHHNCVTHHHTSVTPCHIRDTSSRPWDKPPQERDMGKDDSLSCWESPVTLGVGVSNEEIAGAKAKDNASKWDWARSVPDSQTGVQVWVTGVCVSLGTHPQVTLRDGCSTHRGRGSQVNWICRSRGRCSGSYGGTPWLTRTPRQALPLSDPVAYRWLFPTGLPMPSAGWVSPKSGQAC